MIGRKNCSAGFQNVVLSIADFEAGDIGDQVLRAGFHFGFLHKWDGEGTLTRAASGGGI